MPKRHYPWLWFDADGTLFDYNLAEVTALKKTFESLRLRYEDDYLKIYQEINHGLWQALERQEIRPDVLRVRRFQLLLANLKLDGIAEVMSTAYIEQLGLCTDLINGAYEILDALHGKCRFAIVTNGLQAVQHSRLSLSKIHKFIDVIIISEEVGAAKPHSAFFEIASERTGHPAKSEVLIIGDSLSSDIRGGVDYGIDTCWYNPAAAARPDALPITYEIKHLKDLLEIVE
ncbi:MAG TPA: YjjG family noncanonical pyrimidine nucleotidase [Anaerolineales bacterium]|nr:YjjG family noncanonical pyrimidine nucleotidase [Anaerolineales bacterium]